MARFLLAHSWHQALDPAERALDKPYPPVGVLASLAEARAAGHALAFYDPTFAPEVDAFALALDGHRPERVAILADPHAVPQKMCLASVREAALRMVALARARGAEVFVAGPDVSDHPEAYTAADVVAVGEHDHALLRFFAGDSPRGVLPRAGVRADLDRLPLPAWSDVDLREYARRWRRRHGLWELNVAAARGCPYRCNWCAKPTWGRTWQARPPEAVAAEVRALRALGVDRAWFTDDIFGVRRDWLDRYRAAGPGLPFRCNTRADLVRDPAYAAALAEAGCVEVWMGAESGSDPVLAAMDKDQTVDDVRRACALLRAHHIRVGFFLQLGYPGEAYPDVLATLRMLRELGPDDLGVSVSYPLPGTPFHERVKAELGEAHWSRSMENRVLHASAYDQAFYDAAREVIRAEHALRSWQPEWSRRGLRRTAALPAHLLRWPLHRTRLWWEARTA